MKKQSNIRLLLIALSIAMILMIPSKSRAQAALPAPDFSEMEKYYQIVKWDYADNGNITMVIKPKTDPPQVHRLFTFRFFDADGVAMDYKYTICCPGYSSPAGQTERVESPAPDESRLKKIKSVIVYRILDDGSLVGPQPGGSGGNSGTAESTAAPTGEQAEAAGAGDDQPTDCDYTAQPPLGGSRKFSEALVKSALYERYSFEKDTGGLSSPLAVGLSFLEIRLLNSYANTVTVVPGRGAQRKHDGAPAGAIVYRFHAKYIVCRKYSGAVRRTQYESDNVCFKAANGNWDCPVDSVPKITELN